MDQIGNIIPNLAYDLIGRIIPGFLFCLILSTDAQIQLLIGTGNLSDTVIFWTFLFSSYTVGFLLDAWSFPFFWIIDTFIIFKIFKSLKITEDNIKASQLWSYDIWALMPKANIGDGPKKLAELTFFRVTCASWIILCLFEVSFVASISLFHKIAFLLLTIVSIYRWEWIVRVDLARSKNLRLGNKSK